MENEDDFTQVLKNLDLNQVSEELVQAFFDTGGTAVRSEGDIVTQNDLIENMSLDKLRNLKRIFENYLDISNSKDEMQRFWDFVSSEELICQVMGEPEGRTNGYAIYRTFLTILHMGFDIREGYNKLEDTEKIERLQKALLSSSIYLAWLQLPGGSAYSIFMPYIYRQVLDVVKKWAQEVCFLMDPRTSSNSRKQADEFLGGSSRETSSHAAGEADKKQLKRLKKYGIDLLNKMQRFLKKFSFSSSKESIIPTIEAIVYIQATIASFDKVISGLDEICTVILTCLLNESHGDSIEVARIILHCYIPGIVLQEPTTASGGNRGAIRFHKVAVKSVAQIRKTLSNRTDGPREFEEESTILLALLHNICLRVPDRADERNRMLSYVFALLCEAFCNNTENQREMAATNAKFIRFLTSYSHNSKVKFRQFSVELISRLVLEANFWKTSKGIDLPQDLAEFASVSVLLEALIDRSNDKVSTVRAKALSGLSSALSLGLKSVSFSEDGASLEDSEFMGSMLRETLYVASNDIGPRTAEETPLMSRLIELFREGVSDDKTFVRKAAINALEALISARNGSIHSSMAGDLLSIHSRCTDSSVIVRTQAMKSLSSILLKFPSDAEVQKLWNLGVVPLCVDPEASVQACALDLVSKILFERIIKWYETRGQTSLIVSGAVWRLTSHLDGVMVRCAQKALRHLIRDNCIDVGTLIDASICAIRESIRIDEDNEEDCLLKEYKMFYWSFGWIMLEEFSYSGKLVKMTSKSKREKNMSVIITCWNKLQSRKLPLEYNEGSKRILRVISTLAPLMDKEDAQNIADSISASVFAFNIPLNVLPEAISTLHSICKSGAPDEARGKEISAEWGQRLLELCEKHLRTCFESTPKLALEQPILVQKLIVSIGEVALLEFNKDDDKGRDSSQIALLPISSSIKALIQSFLLPEMFLCNSTVASTPRNGTEELQVEEVVKEETSLQIPTQVRSCAFVTLGKICLRDQELAKSCITMLIRELRTCPIQSIRSNVLLLLGDLCIRYTSLVDIYIPTIALSFLDESTLIRRNALLLFSQLILQDYVKWRESLLRFFLRAAVDKDQELGNLARHVLSGPLLLKSPHLLTNKFVEMVFVFNNCKYKRKYEDELDEEVATQIALPGNKQYPLRSRLYNFMLENMSDEQKLQISMKLCTDILEETTEGKLPLCEDPSNIDDFGIEAVLKDTFMILCSPDIKLSSAKDVDTEEDSNIEEPTSMASQLAAAKGKLLSKMSKKNFLENVVPVLIGLKQKLQSKRSPVMRYLLHYFRELFKIYRQDMKDILSTDPQLSMELDYDLRQYENQNQRTSARKTKTPSRTTPFKSPTTFSRTPIFGSACSRNEFSTPARTPLQVLEITSTQVCPQSVPRLRQVGSAQKTPSSRRKCHSNIAENYPVQNAHPSGSKSKNPTSIPPSTMIFSPSRALSPRSQGSWKVSAKSPGIMSKSSTLGEESTQNDLEKNIRDMELEDSPGNKENNYVNTQEQSSTSTVPKNQVGNDVENEEEEFVPLPLKKKQRQRLKGNNEQIIQEKRVVRSNRSTRTSKRRRDD